jgi:small GTP-binding protein
MIQKKICLMGSFAVGKTSLIARYVKSIFSDKYLTTVGVMIDKKEIRVSGQEVTLIVWDLHGEDDFQKVRMSYLRGSSGYILVADGTRPFTLNKAMLLHDEARAVVGDVPLVLVLNKSDLTDEWEIEESMLDDARARGWVVMNTSAKTGSGVEEAFQVLARKILGA